MATITKGLGDNNFLGKDNESDLILADPPVPDNLGGDDTVRAGGGDDTVYGFGGNNRIWGGDGNDVLITADGEDKIYGDTGNDDVQSGRGDDLVYGGSGNDTLRGGEDNDLLFGEEGHDRLIGGSNGDTLSGGAGRDTLEGRGGGDVLNLDKDGETDIVVFTADDLGAVDKIRGMNTVAREAGGDVLDLSAVAAGGLWLEDVGDDVKIHVLPQAATVWQLIAIVEDIGSDASVTDADLLLGNLSVNNLLV